MAAMETIGSDIANFSCPRCGAHDRERHLVLYLNAIGLMAKVAGARVLHIAPEQNLSRIIRRQQPATYVMGDLFPAHEGIRRVDLTAIDFPASSFDLVIANHVMEHVSDDLAALREIHRVLGEGGHAILQTPYSQLLHEKFEDPGIATEEARLQAYGQEDHVRLYGRDIAKRFASVGFVDCTVTHKAALPRINANRYGVNALEPLLLFRRGPVSPGAERIERHG